MHIILLMYPDVPAIASANVPGTKKCLYNLYSSSQEMIPITDELGPIIKELTELGKVTRLSGPQKERAQELMSILRAADFSLEQIRQLTGKFWSVSTIKQYSKGARIDRMSGKGGNADYEIIHKIIESGISLDEASELANIKANLTRQGLQISDVGQLLQETRNYGMSEKDVMAVFQRMRASRIPLDQISEILNYSNQLEKWGIGPDTLKTILEAAKIYRNVDKIIQAINSQGSLLKIESEIKDLETKKKTVVDDLGKKESRLAVVNDELKKAEASLRTYRDLQNQGLDEAALKTMLNLSGKHGGVKKTIEAVQENNRSSSSIR